jgi:hypothetical protein
MSAKAYFKADLPVNSVEIVIHGEKEAFGENIKCFKPLN